MSGFGTAQPHRTLLIKIKASRDDWSLSYFMDDELTEGILTLVCPATEGEISTGAIYTMHDLARASRAKVHLYCRFCKKSHVFEFSTALLRPVRH